MSSASKPLSEARVAIVFEWFHQFGGAEQVIAEMLKVFPGADLFALVHDPKKLVGTPLEGMPVHTSFIQGLPFAKEKYRLYLPLMPIAVEQLDLRSYDLILSSSHAVTKGILTHSDQLHISYTHTPVRYAWDLYLEYLSNSGMSGAVKGLPARLVLHYLRMWDVAASNRVDVYLANSQYVARRIYKLYRRTAHVVYPPVDITPYDHTKQREEFFVTVSRFVPYKRMDLIVETFTRMKKPLVVIGDGPEREKVQRLAGPSVRFLGYQPDEVVVDHLQRARGFIFAANEDFGIAPVEAQAAGCPVVAYGKGGALETVVNGTSQGATGVFFNTQTPGDLQAAVESLEVRKSGLRPEACRQNAERFSVDCFLRQFESVVSDEWSRFQSGYS